MKILSYFGLLCICSLAGCANLNSVYRPLDTSQGQGALIDIKQRAIVVNRNGVTETNKTGNVVVCAEPSPDAMAAYAAELSANIKNAGGATADLTANTREAAAYIGYRTSSIQLLRDSMYRNCEAYANGAIEKGEYALLLRRDQRYMAALLGIESLSQVKSNSPVRVETTNAPAKEAGSSASTDSAAGTDAKAKTASSTTGVTASKPSVDSGSGNGNGSAATNASLEAVQAIKEIVFKLVDNDDAPTLCFNLISQTTGSLTDAVSKHCGAILGEIASHNKTVSEKLVKCSEKTNAAEKADCEKTIPRKLNVWSLNLPVPMVTGK